MFYTFVGDIHSNNDSLQKLLKNHESWRHLVFLGDINDSRKGDSTFLEVYFQVRDAVTSGRATLINSNHQKNLINILIGKRTNLGIGMRTTLNELQKENLVLFTHENEKLTHLEIIDKPFITSMVEWFDSRLLVFNGDGVVGVHAQYNPLLTGSKFKQCCLYGSRDKDRQRITWWKTYKESPFVVAGHYHEVYQSDNCAIIDGGCGDEDGELYTFDWPERNIKLVH